MDRAVPRRRLLVAIAFAAIGIAAPALSQQARIRRIGVLYLASRQSFEDTGRRGAFLKGMQDLGYAQGKDFILEERFANGDEARLADHAAELVRLKVDVILTVGSQGSSAASRATSTIPIVIAAIADPVGEGFAATLARPGRNITGLSTNLDVMPKQLDLLTTVIPKLSRVAVLRNSANSGHNSMLNGVQSAARTRDILVIPLEGRTPADIDQAFATITGERADALIVLADTFFLQQRRKIADLALKYRLPSIFASEEYAQAGGLMSYGYDPIQNFVLAATFVDKIFKGANPVTLPFVQPSNFNLVINRATAKSLGLRIPEALLLRAEKVI